MMSFKSTLLAAVAAVSFALPAFAGGIMVDDAYARSSSMQSASGAAFMVISNHTGSDDRLIDATSPMSERVELHTHLEDSNGVMQMIHVTEGFDLAAGGTLMLERGGHHVMFLGLTAPMEQDATFPLTLVIEKAGPVEVEVTVDLNRKPMHGKMKHGQMKNAAPSN